MMIQTSRDEQASRCSLTGCNKSAQRPGFTLIEILVCTALTLFILSLLAQAFVLGSDTFRTLKAVGDLNDGLRTAATMVRTDLAADHFEGKRRLSESRFTSDGPPQQGYFALYQDPTVPPSGPEALDADNLPTQLTTGNVLAFTTKARGNRPQDYYCALVPTATLPSLGVGDNRYQPPSDARGQYFSSQWIEVVWFVSPLKGLTAGGTPLYGLYRQQRLVVADVNRLNWLDLKSPATQYASYNSKISCKPNPNPAMGTYLYFNSPSDLTLPPRRTAGPFPPTSLGNFVPLIDPTTGQKSGEDLVLQDVLAFDVKVLLQGGTDFVSISSAFPTAGASFPKAYFDTWSNRHDDLYDYSPTAAQPKPIPSQQVILAVQITLRVWDPKLLLTRQITIIQDL